MGFLGSPEFLFSQGRILSDGLRLSEAVLFVYRLGVLFKLEVFKLEVAIAVS